MNCEQSKREHQKKKNSFSDGKITVSEDSAMNLVLRKNKFSTEEKRSWSSEVS
jgi:hypothetical protein